MGLYKNFWPRGVIYEGRGYTRSIFIIGSVTCYAFPVVANHVCSQKYICTLTNCIYSRKWG